MADCTELCKTSASPRRRCRCPGCSGDNHGSELDTDSIELQNLKHGDINLLENKEELGGKLQVVLEVLNGAKYTHSVCSDKAFDIGIHCLILGRLQENGHTQDKAGNDYWIYIVCPFCGDEINLRKILQNREPAGEEQ
jgi:hypothetical protein